MLYNSAVLVTQQRDSINNTAWIAKATSLLVASTMFTSLHCPMMMQIVKVLHFMLVAIEASVCNRELTLLARSKFMVSQKLRGLVALNVLI